MNILNGFIFVRQATVIVGPGNVYVAAVLDKITSIPGLTITDYSGTAGPYFFLILQNGNVNVTISGAFKFLGLSFAAMFELSNNHVAAATSVVLVPGVTLGFNFSYYPLDSSRGLTFSALYSDPDKQLIKSIVAGIKDIFGDLTAGIENAKQVTFYGFFYLLKLLTQPVGLG